MWLSTWTDWTIFFIVVQIIHFLGTWQLYRNAGKKAWQAAIPIYNAIVLLDIIKRPKWWVILLFLPIISPIIIMIFWVDLIRSFGKRSVGDAALVIVSLGIYIYYLNYAEKPKYTGPEKRKETFISAVLFAVVLATIVHTFFVQPMIIPTGSMENTLRIGDALFVSKNNYGTRLPNTPVAVPFADIFSRNLFVEKLQLPYVRIPGWQKVKKNDIVVFNFPADSVFSPLDRKDNYVKRVVATPGDVLQIKNGILYVNDNVFKPNSDALLQHRAGFVFKTQISPKYLKEELGQVDSDYGMRSSEHGYYYEFAGLTNEMFEILKNNPNTVESKWIIQPENIKEHKIFPKEMDYNVDWYGPIKIPKKGETIELSIDNLVFYIDLIEKYEGNDLEVQDGKLLMNSKPVKNYTFQQDYYFMMGDNRHNSLDSRFFGFVPETHIIGKPFFLWANLNQVFGFEARNGFNFDRWFTVPNNNTPSKTSYLWVGIILLIAYFGYDFLSKKKKKKNKK